MIPQKTPENLDELFQTHEKELKRYLYRKLSCAETADDLIQETFLRIAERHSHVDFHNVRAYLYRIAQNLLIDHFRRERRQQTYPDDFEGLGKYPDAQPSVEDDISGRQKLALLRKALLDLPLLTQRIFELNRMEGLTYAEVAQRLGVSESTVQKHLARGLCHAMKALKSL